MAFFIGNSFCRLCQVDEKQLMEELLICSKGLLAKGLSLPDNAVQSARLPASSEAWILSGKHADQFQPLCIKIDLKKAPSDQISNRPLLNEILLHTKIYNLRPDVNSICHTRNPYSLYATLNGSLEKVHGEAALILGDIPIIDYNSFHNARFYIDEKKLDVITRASIGEPLRPIRTIILKGNSVLGLGACIHEARAFVEILEEWAMFDVFAKIYGGPHHILTLEQLRSLGSRYARSIKFGGRQSSKPSQLKED
jgi:ribulose-5-phosphate 4-epimerase/fuculose-1-phosphate aldolase